MDWKTFYLNIVYDKDVPTIVQHINELENFEGKTARNVIKAIIKLVNNYGYNDQALKLLKRAMDCGVRFYSSHVAQIQENCPDDFKTKAIEMIVLNFNEEDTSFLVYEMDDKDAADIIKKYNLPINSDTYYRLYQNLCKDITEPIEWKYFIKQYRIWDKDFAREKLKYVKNYGDESEVIWVLTSFFSGKEEPNQIDIYVNKLLDANYSFDVKNIIGWSYSGITNKTKMRYIDTYYDKIIADSNIVSKAIGFFTLSFSSSEREKFINRLLDDGVFIDIDTACNECGSRDFATKKRIAYSYLNHPNAYENISKWLEVMYYDPYEKVIDALNMFVNSKTEIDYDTLTKFFEYCDINLHHPHLSERDKEAKKELEKQQQEKIKKELERQQQEKIKIELEKQRQLEQENQNRIRLEQQKERERQQKSEEFGFEITEDTLNDEIMAGLNSKKVVSQHKENDLIAYALDCEIEFVIDDLIIIGNRCNDTIKERALFATADLWDEEYTDLYLNGKYSEKLLIKYCLFNKIKIPNDLKEAIIRQNKFTNSQLTEYIRKIKSALYEFNSKYDNIITDTINRAENTLLALYKVRDIVRILIDFEKTDKNNIDEFAIMIKIRAKQDLNKKKQAFLQSIDDTNSYIQKINNNKEILDSVIGLKHMINFWLANDFKTALENIDIISQKDKIIDMILQLADIIDTLKEYQ